MEVNNNINIPKILSEKYYNWTVNYPKIYQIDEECNIVKVWNSKKDIVSYFKKRIQGLDLALRKRCRFCGYFWIVAVLYDNEGIRPEITEKRNSFIYAYDPYPCIIKNIDNLEINNFFDNENKFYFRFIGRFENSVLAGEYLDLSVTNIRRVAKKEIKLHKEYFFSFNPLIKIHQIAYDIDSLIKKSNIIKLIDEDCKRLELLKLDFVKERDILYNYINENKIEYTISDIEIKISKILE